MTDPITVTCPECRSSAGDPCRDRFARAKPTCAARSNVATLARANAPAPAVRPDDFDETTPPPKGRPIGSPIPRHIVLPPGELVSDQFREWDAAGRVPAGAVLCHAFGDCPPVAWCDGEKKPVSLDGYMIAAWIVVKPRQMPAFVVLVPATERAFVLRRGVA